MFAYLIVLSRGIISVYNFTSTGNMADIFTKIDAEKLLKKKNFWFFGDSNMRGLYKDLIWLLENNSLITLNCLRGKLEKSFMNDTLVRGGALHRGRNFQEIRRYKNFKLETNIEFTFLTQCCSKEIEERLKDAYNKNEIPDVLAINSCLWDITRWGPESVGKYKSNINDLLKFFKNSLPSKTRLVWVTTPPVSNEPRGGFFIKQIEFLKHTLRFDVMEANNFVSRQFILHRFDVLDIHYHLLLQIHRRRPDGIHWNPEAVRHITNLFLTHISISWNVPLPGNFKSPLIYKLHVQCQENPSYIKPSETESTVKTVNDSANLFNTLLPKKSKKRKKRKDDSLPEPILFKEKLYVFDENGRRIGRFSLNIDQEDSDTDTPKILFVHISNRAFINGKLSESVVTGTVTHKLKTLEEIRYECTEVSNSGKHERCMFLLREKTKYYLSVTNTICDFKSQTNLTIPFAEALGLIGESANAVLMRKLARKGYEGILCLKTVLSNGKRCKNYYVTKLSEQIVNGEKMQVLIVYRNITNHRKFNVTMTLALTRAGQMIYLFWSNSKYFLHIDPDVEINTKRFTYGESGLHRHWHKDIQLHSLYLDRVDCQMALYRSFKYQNEQLRRLLEDFILYLLLTKPDDIICFAINYFTSFGHDTSRKCPSKTKFPQKNFEDLFDLEEYQEKEGEKFFLWCGEDDFYDEN